MVSQGPKKKKEERDQDLMLFQQLTEGRENALFSNQKTKHNRLLQI